jgi:hypothetical protein
MGRGSQMRESIPSLNWNSMKFNEPPLAGVPFSSQTTNIKLLQSVGTIDEVVELSDDETEKSVYPEDSDEIEPDTPTTL